MSFGDWKLGKPLRHNGLNEPIVSKEQTSFPVDDHDRSNDTPRFEKVSMDMTEDDIKEQLLFPSKWKLSQFLSFFKYTRFFTKCINLARHIQYGQAIPHDPSDPDYMFRILLPDIRFWGDNDVNIAKKNSVRRSINREIKHRCDRIESLYHNIVANEISLDRQAFSLNGLIAQRRFVEDIGIYNKIDKDVLSSMLLYENDAVKFFLLHVSVDPFLNVLLKFAEFEF
uniref:Uncharacterized protein n=2 Tax=Meloidogyne TaxID=189290 RepID=A0A914M6U6_MELIC